LSRPLITLIAGPTASGKSRLALELAAKSHAVILNADSQQLYADLRVLSARPSVEEEAQAEHRLYGVADAADAWSVGRWTRAILPLLDELRAEKRPALIVGGTGLYFTALTKGLAEIPPVPIAAREEAGALYDTEGEAAFRLRADDLRSASGGGHRARRPAEAHPGLGGGAGDGPVAVGLAGLDPSPAGAPDL
jgi:tRNA dimethylallyltransferase